MKRILLLFFFTLLNSLSFSQNTYVPDDRFESFLISKGYDSTGMDDYVPTSSIDTITTIDIVGFQISDMTGIEDFISLKKLECAANEFTTLDLSSNIELTYLDFAFNKISEIDLTHNIKLDTLRFYNNLLTEIDLSKNTLLEYIDAFDNELNSLDISQNINLLRLNCYNNNISNLDISQNLKLERLSCSSNQITNIDVSNNLNLLSLAISSNLLTELDVSKNTNLEELVCGVNELDVLDVRENKKLTYLSCGSNNLSELDISQNTLLSVYFSCSNNNLTSLDVSNNPLLTNIHCSFNQIETLDVSNNLLLESISCSANKLTTLDLSNNPNLKYVSCRFSENLESFNIQNGNNENLDRGFWSIDNPKLLCIQVDNAVYSSANWQNVDAHTIFSENCSTLSNGEFYLTEFYIYPNPTKEKLYIGTTMEVDYIVYTVSGNKIRKGKLSLGKNKVDISELKAGIYYVKLKNERVDYTQKMVKL